LKSDNKNSVENNLLLTGFHAFTTGKLSHAESSAFRKLILVVTPNRVNVENVSKNNANRYFIYVCVPFGTVIFLYFIGKKLCLKFGGKDMKNFSHFGTFSSILQKKLFGRKFLIAVFQYLFQHFHLTIKLFRIQCFQFFQIHQLPTDGRTQNSP
jgi:hypothetical protein